MVDVCGRSRDETMKMRGRVLLCLILVGGVLSGCAQEQREAQPVTGWEHIVASPLNHTLFGAVFLSAEEGWAVGERGALLRYRAGRWEPLPSSPTDKHLFSVAFPSQQQGWAVGAWGTILRYEEGTGWQTVETPSGLENVNFEKVTFPAPDRGWAVGDSAGIAHYDGQRWKKVDAPIMRLVQEQQQQADTERYGLVAEAFRGSGFQEEAGYFHDVAFLTPEHGWIVGNLGQILRYDGERWQEVDSPTRKHLYSVVSLSSGDAWAVGQEGTILYYSGQQERWTEWPSSPTRRHLLSLVARSEREMYAVGQGGIILRYDGTAWREYAGPQVKRMINFYFVTLQPAGDRLWTFSTTRTIFSRSLRPEPSPAPRPSS